MPERFTRSPEIVERLRAAVAKILKSRGRDQARAGGCGRTMCALERTYCQCMFLDRISAMVVRPLVRLEPSVDVPTDAGRSVDQAQQAFCALRAPQFYGRRGRPRLTGGIAALGSMATPKLRSQPTTENESATTLVLVDAGLGDHRAPLRIDIRPRFHFRAAV